ncbi:MAG: hypothetical protein LBR74_10160 [Eubacterium sp.]|jgi:peptidoglycan hydrolase CwlO-like protein|nr:hypothetical protein [Eubacterium sp.]
MDNEQIKELVEIKQRALSNSHRLEAQEDQIKEIREEMKQLYSLNTELRLLTQTVASMSGKLDEVQHATNKLADEINEVQHEPQKNKAGIADRIFWIIATLLITGVAAFILHAVMPQIF